MTSRRAAVLPTAAVLLLSACGTGWPDDAGGPGPPGFYAGLADRALFRDVVDGEFEAAHVTGDDAVVYVLGDRPFDVERDDLPRRPPDVLLAHLVTADGLGEPVVFTEGEVLAEDPPGADLPGSPTPDGTARVLFGADTREAPPGDSPGYDRRLPWVQYATAAGEPAGPRVPLAEASAVVVDSHLRPDGTLLVAVQEERSDTTRLLALAPGDPAPTVLAETGGAPPPDALVVDEDAGQAHLLGAQDVLVPVLLTVDWGTGEVTGTGPLCPEDAAFDHLRLTAAGAVAVGSCEGRAEGLWVLR